MKKNIFVLFLVAILLPVMAISDGCTVTITDIAATTREGEVLGTETRYEDWDAGGTTTYDANEYDGYQCKKVIVNDGTIVKGDSVTLEHDDYQVPQITVTFMYKVADTPVQTEPTEPATQPEPDPSPAQDPVVSTETEPEQQSSENPPAPEVITQPVDTNNENDQQQQTPPNNNDPVDPVMEPVTNEEPQPQPVSYPETPIAPEPVPEQAQEESPESEPIPASIPEPATESVPEVIPEPEHVVEAVPVEEPAQQPVVATATKVKKEAHTEQKTETVVETPIEQKITPDPAPVPARATQKRYKITGKQSTVHRIHMEFLDLNGKPVRGPYDAKIHDGDPVFYEAPEINGYVCVVRPDVYYSYPSSDQDIVFYYAKEDELTDDDENLSLPYESEYFKLLKQKVKSRK